MFTIYSDSGLHEEPAQDLPLQRINESIDTERRHLAAIVEHSNEVILSQDLDGAILSWNRMAQTKYGYTADEILGCSIRALFPDDRKDDVSSLLARIRCGTCIEPLETIWRRKDGGLVHVALTFSPIKNEDDAVIGVSTVARDVTHEKKLRTELARERTLIDAAFNALRDIFFVIDLNGRLVRWNDYMTLVSGYTHGELAHMRALDLFTEASREEVERAIAEVLVKGNAHLVADGLAKDGRIIPFELIGAVLREPDGAPFAICGIARKITEQRQFEDTLRLTQFAIDHCSDAAYWMEPDGRIFYVNREVCRILGYTREELLGMSVYDIDPNFQTDTWNDHWHLIKENRSLRLESVHRTKTGVNIPVDISANYVRFGEREYNCAFARDLSEKRNAEQKAREYEIRMHMSQRMEALGTLAGGIAHDFNNILSSILGFSELVLDKIPRNSELHDNVQEIFTAGMRARDLVRQILTFSRQAEQEKQPIQLKLIVKETLKLLRASIPTTIDIRSDLQCADLVLADASQMHQVVMNLCTNASQAMQPEGGLLQVSLERIELTAEDAATHPASETGDHIALTVIDSGRGIEPGILDRIFNPFFTTKRQGEGTGLGLSMVHGIVSDHGGHVRVRSKVGQGTTFAVYLPIHKRTPKPLLDAEQDLPTGNERILLVDDEPAIAKMAMLMLQGLKYQVTYLTSSIEALAYFQDDPSQYDLVITDLTMPHLPGQKLAAELMKIRPDIPVILCTGFKDQVCDALSRDLGVQAVLMKPIEKSKLATAVRSVLDGRSGAGK